MKSRIFNICQYEKKPDDGKDLGFNEDCIKSGLSYRSIKKWAYICHDKDVYTEEDEINTGYKKAGEPKPRHWHVVLQCGSNIEVETIARWFNVPENMIDVPKGHGAFMDCVRYLTHESEKCQAEGKYLYEDKEVKANFNFREEITRAEEDKLKYGKNLSKKERLQYQVRYEGLRLKEAQKDRLTYMEIEDKLRKARLYYISEQNPPKTRINYYVYGDGGVGKGLACRALARALFPDMEDYDVFFEVGAKGAAFEGYDGQPVVIWNDRRAVDLLQELGGRGNVFNIFDTHPSKQRQNVKYGSVNLCNFVNIVNSVQPYEDFLDGLAGSYTSKDGNVHKAEDKKQSYRRFWFIIPINMNDLDVMVNKGVFGHSDMAEEYEQFRHIRYSFSHTRQQLSGEPIVEEIETQILKPVVEKHNEIIDWENTARTPAEINNILNGTGLIYTQTADGAWVIAGDKNFVAKPEKTSTELLIDTLQKDALLGTPGTDRRRSRDDLIKSGLTYEYNETEKVLYWYDEKGEIALVERPFKNS